MSLEGFQRALADLIGSPPACVEARSAPDRWLDRYALTERERTRLVCMAKQPGMATNCSLYRSNRVTPIYTLLHYSCLALGERLEAELGQYWRSTQFTDLQFRLEVERFASFLRERVRSGALEIPALPELLELELACNELQFVPRRRLLEEQSKRGALATDDRVVVSPLARVLRFSCDAEELLSSLANGAKAPPFGACPSYVVASVLESPWPDVTALREDVGMPLWDLARGLPWRGNEAARDALVRSGILTGIAP